MSDRPAGRPESNKSLIVILGPTGVGKSDVAIELAEHFVTDIISADSRQFYREMKTGTAVPSDEQLARVRHHFIRFISVKEYFSASLFERAVISLLPSLFKPSDVVFMAGGSGLYIDAVCKGIDDIPDTDPVVREKYNSKYKEEGIESLRKELKIVDPVFYSRVDLRNHKRIIRALEVYATTGLPYSGFLVKKTAERDFSIIKIGLTRDRAELYSRINSRVDEMLRLGLEEEARELHGLKELSPLKCVGYSEFFDFFDGLITHEKAVELIKRNSRHYAKRQLTWWSRDSEITWFHPSEIHKMITFITNKAGRVNE